MTDYKTPLTDRDDIPKNPDILSPLINGRWILFVFLAIFMLWSVFFPLDKAAVAPGVIIVDSNRRVIEHLEGGVIEKILVDNGQHVKKDEPLIILDAAQAQAKKNATSEQYVDLLAKEARLIAERDKKSSIDFPKDLMEKVNEKAVMEDMDTQQQIFDDNQNRVQKTVASLEEKIKYLHTQISDLQSQTEVELKRAEYAQKELDAAKQVLKKHYVSKSDVWRLEQAVLLAKSAYNEHKSDMAQAQQMLTQTELQITTVYTDRRKEILAELQKTQDDLAQAKEAYNAAVNVLSHMVIRSPVYGTVLNKQKISEGGVVRNGDLLMEVVPDNDALVIESHVNPRDIDMIQMGMRAKVLLTAYLQRRTPMVTGHVTRVAADAVQDPKSGEYYYDIRVTIDASQLERLKHVKLYPGMPAQVSLIVDSRSLWDYLTTPIVASFQKAFVEE